MNTFRMYFALKQRENAEVIVIYKLWCYNFTGPANVRPLNWNEFDTPGTHQSSIYKDTKFAFSPINYKKNRILLMQQFKGLVWDVIN